MNPIRNFILIIVSLALLFITGFVLAKIKTEDQKINRIVLGALLLIFIIVGTVWILKVPNQQTSDFGNFWSRAPVVFTERRIYSSPTDYFAKYAYQTGFIIYVASVIKIFGFNIFAIQFLNVIYQALILLFTYLLVNKIFKKVVVARLSVLLLMIDLDWFALNSQTDNQYLGSLLYLITFYLLMNDKIWSYILAGITLTGGCLVRPIGPVIIAGIVVFAIFYIWFTNNNYKAALKVVLSLLIYFVLFAVAGWGIKASGINEYGLSNTDQEWKFMVGLHYQSNGTYSNDMNNFIDDSKPRETTRRIEKAQIKKEIKYLNDNNLWLKFFFNKNQLLWSTPTMATDFTSYNLNHSPTTVKIIDFLAYLGSIFLIIFSWIGSLKLFKTKFSKNLYLLILPLMAFVVVQLLIEVQGRYRIEFLPIIAVIGGLGFAQVLNWFKYLLPKSKKAN
ncbi:hypothetical protein [Companilactobacillus halodurans]|uniref:ArnT family glycosyltransferase n=1 Tax=Companilactobacillus halodurans TaxID=2584183 RepID=UPI00307F2634